MTRNKRFVDNGSNLFARRWIDLFRRFIICGGTCLLAVAVSIGGVSLASSTAQAAVTDNSGHDVSTAPVGVSHRTSIPTSRAFSACEADGASITTAMKSFRAKNPGVLPTQALLTGQDHGGPDLLVVFLQRSDLLLQNHCGKTLCLRAEQRRQDRVSGTQGVSEVEVRELRSSSD